MNKTTDFDLNSSFLGKKSETPEKYDTSLLFRIPRTENRIRYGIKEDELKFIGADVWNCYEISFLTNNGCPVSRILKFIYPCESEFLVESKSLKLYLNSFNMERCGKTIQDAESTVLEMIRKDLGNLLETNVKAVFFNDKSDEQIPFRDLKFRSLIDLVSTDKLESTNFTHFSETPELLKGMLTEKVQHYVFSTDILRSNCRVTNQPDWGDLFVRISTSYEIDLLSVIAYLISFRKENHFHEEVVEMIFMRFLEIFKAEKLMVAAMYTRRGGIDINPIRASHPELLDEVLLSTTSRCAKTLRQ